MAYTELAPGQQQFQLALHMQQANSAVSAVDTTRYKRIQLKITCDIVQELCESRGGRPGLSVLTSILVSVDVKNY